MSREKGWCAPTVESGLSVPVEFGGVFQGGSHVTDLIRLPRWKRAQAVGPNEYLDAGRSGTDGRPVVLSVFL